MNKMIIAAKLTKVRFILGVAEPIDVFYLRTVLEKKALIKKQFEYINSLEPD